MDSCHMAAMKVFIPEMASYSEAPAPFMPV